MLVNQWAQAMLQVGSMAFFVMLRHERSTQIIALFSKLQRREESKHIIKR
jgi:hypothetical protein